MLFPLALSVVLAVTAGPKHGLAYERTGSGPAILLIHGLGGDHSVWSREAQRLSKGHTVIAVDLPGHGASPAPERVRLRAIADQIAALLEDEKVGKAVVVGHSIGGILASLVAVQHPDQVRALVVVDSSPGPIPWPEKDRAEVRQKLEANEQAGLVWFFGQMAKDKKQTERLASQAAHVPGPVLTGYIDEAATHGAGPRLPRFNRPILLMASPLLLAGKKPAAEEAAAIGYAHLHDFSVERFPASGHWLFLDEPQHFDRTLDAFLAKVKP